MDRSSTLSGPILNATKSDTRDLRDRDIQQLSPSEADDVLTLRRFVEAVSGAHETEADQGLNDWAAALLAQLPQPHDAVGLPRIARAYTTFQLSALSGARAYKVRVRVDNNFGSIRDRVRDHVQRMLDRAVRDQTARFLKRARSVNLQEEWRRPRSRPFPHVLPYLTPPPRTRDEIYVEEAGLVTAAVHFAFSRSGITLDVNHYSEEPTVKPGRATAWSCGFANVNSYNSDLALAINLNERAIRDAGFSNNFWASTVGHEVLHTVGWGHPKGKYPADLPIEIWQWCIQTAGGSFIEEPADIIAIR